ncbi:hypothetical protein E4U40_007348 [Claviceps sp. LM458 group G5]|nr:hypothetical protein E4U40_007348 [Claviceps sp. LM458 group G5]
MWSHLPIEVGHLSTLSAYTGTRSSARQASKKLSEGPESEATATDTVKQEDDLFSDGFPDDEPLPYLWLDKSLLSEQSEPDPDIQLAFNAQLSASPDEMADRKAVAQWALRTRDPRGRDERQATPKTISFGGTNVKPTGLAAHGHDQGAKNPAYDPKAFEIAAGYG